MEEELIGETGEGAEIHVSAEVDDVVGKGEEVGVGCLEKGNWDSTNWTWRETYIREVDGSRQW